MYVPERCRFGHAKKHYLRMLFAELRSIFELATTQLPETLKRFSKDMQGYERTLFESNVGRVLRAAVVT